MSKDRDEKLAEAAAEAEAAAAEEREAAQGVERAGETAEPTVEPAAEGAGEWRERYLRTLAELDNYRKRVERDRDQAQAYALEGILREFLPVLDDLELAIEAAGDADAIREGVRVALKRALKVLESEGLVAIEALDRLFDPRLHEALGGIPGTGKPAGTIVNELRKGYRLHDRVLRPSRVRIAMEMPAPEAEEPEEPEEPEKTAKTEKTTGAEQAPAAEPDTEE